MSRLKRQQNIDGLANALRTIQQNQRSLSENDLNLIEKAIEKLQKLRKKKGLTDKHYEMEISDIVSLLNNFLTN